MRKYILQSFELNVWKYRVDGLVYSILSSNARNLYPFDTDVGPSHQIWKDHNVFGRQGGHSYAKELGLAQ